MTRVFFDGRDLEIVVRRDGIDRVYPLASIAAVLRIETVVLAARFAALLKAGDDLSTGTLADGPSRESFPFGTMEEEPTEVVVQRPTITNQEEKLNPDHTNHPSIPWSDAREASPEEIAEVLGPDANLTAIASLVRDVPAHVVSSALNQALAVPGVRLRASRAALFTAIVRRMTGGSSSPSTPYARTPTSTT